MNYTLTIDDNVLYIHPSGNLTRNTEYLVSLHPDISGAYPPSSGISNLGSEYSFWFTSQYCPLFTTVGRVKLLAGPEADTIVDDTIYRMIHKNSLDIIDYYEMSYNKVVADDYWGCTYENVPLQMKRYTECKTAYDVLNFARIAAQGGSNGGANQTKSLGDMTIRYGGSSSTANGPDPNKLKDLYECWNESLKMIRNLRVAVKGFYDESKGFAHPAREGHHNRVIRGVNYTNSNPAGPWEPSRNWIGYRYPHRGRV